MANAAAVAADCPRIMNTGSMRMLPNAMCELDTHTGTSRLSAWPCFGTIDPYAIWYGPLVETPMSPSFCTKPFGRDVALDVVRVDAVGAHADRIGRRPAFQQLVFGHDVGADHPPRLPHVDLMRPVPVVGELVARQPPRSELGLHVRRHARIGGDEVQPALLVVARARG